MLSKLRTIWDRPNMRNIIILTSFLFLSRGLGFVRISLISTHFDELYSDLLLASTKIPETITSLLIMGTITSSLLPITSRISKKGDIETSTYINLMTFIIIGILTVVTIFSFIFTPELLRFTTNDQYTALLDPNGLFPQYVLTTRILLLGPIFFAIQAIFGVFLNVKNTFLVFSWAGAIYNLGTILGIIIGVRNGYLETATGMMIGAGITSLLFVWEARRFGYKPVFHNLKISYERFAPDIKKTWAVFLPRIFIINGAILANILINSVGKNGQITAFDIGLSIQGIFFSLMTSIGTVIFPDLAKSFNFEDRGFFWKKLRKYIKYVFWLGLGATIATIVFAPLVVWAFALFGKPQPNGDYIVLIARVCTLSLIFQSIQEVLNKYFYIKEHIWIPVIISVTGLVSQVVFIYSSIGLGLDAGIAVSGGLGVANMIVCGVSFLYIYRDKKTEALQHQ
jgi:peptidoglycan biosynthesis protein MviN/MurJ (putative lipid II flippase)